MKKLSIKVAVCLCLVFCFVGCDQFCNQSELVSYEALQEENIQLKEENTDLKKQIAKLEQKTKGNLKNKKTKKDGFDKWGINLDNNKSY